jgi:hypothetical protein
MTGEEIAAALAFGFLIGLIVYGAVLVSRHGWSADRERPNPDAEPDASPDAPPDTPPDDRYQPPPPLTPSTGEALRPLGAVVRVSRLYVMATRVLVVAMALYGAYVAPRVRWVVVGAAATYLLLYAIGRCTSARRLLVALVVVLASPLPPAGAAVTPRGEERQPRNIYELVYAFENTFTDMLSPEELKLVASKRFEEIREANPRLYDRISQDVTRWTDEWIAYVRDAFPPIPAGRLGKAQADAERVDAILAADFEARGWPYKHMKVVFLPPRVFLDERHRNYITSGMFIPFYPDAFFASVDWPAPMVLVLVHESIHFNKRGPWIGAALTEGVTETAARKITLRHGLLKKGDILRDRAYPDERKGVECILKQVMSRSGCTREMALERLLKAYLTGDQSGMDEALGAAAWGRIVRLSKTPGDFQTHRILAALEE